MILLKYSIYNIVYYKKKYVAIFILSFFVSFLLAFSLFVSDGFKKRSSQYARSMGDLQININPFYVEEEEILYFLKSKYEIKDIKCLPYVNGKFFNNRLVKSTSLSTIKVNTELPGFKIVEGKIEKMQVLIPQSWKKDIYIGDTLRFSFQGVNGVFDSIYLKVSGFFVSSPLTGDKILIDEESYVKIVGELNNRIFLVWFVDSFLKNEMLGEDQFETISYYIRESMGSRNEYVQLIPVANNLYSISRSIILLFNVIINIFVLVMIFIILMNVYNVMYITTLDKIKAMAAFLAMGGDKSTLVATSAIEAGILCGIAAVVGLVFALCGVCFLKALEIPLDNYTLIILLGGKNTFDFSISVFSSIGVLFVFILFPALVSGNTVRKILRESISGLLLYKR